MRRQQRHQRSRRQQRPAAAAQMQARAQAAALRQQTGAPAAVEPPLARRRWRTSMLRCLREMTTLMMMSCWMTVMTRTLTKSSCRNWSSSYSRKRLCRELLARQDSGVNCREWGRGCWLLLLAHQAAFAW